jgi:citrate lyase subunit beta/citryl-CoA lyase
MSSPFSWKTMLFLPQFAFAKSGKIPADCFIIDFQDAVPLQAKAAARQGFRKALAEKEFGTTPLVIRINEPGIPEEQKLDLDAVVGLQGITALMPTMTEHPEELDELHEKLLQREQKMGLTAGGIKLLPLIETPAAIMRADAIARSGGGRIIGLFLGHGDLFRLSGATPHAPTTLDFPRNAVLFAARAAGIAAFDTPYTKVSDIIGLEKETLDAKRHGFDGKACIHSSQIETVKRFMQPSPDELAWASRVEDVRKKGLLNTLARKLNQDETGNKARRQTDGMGIVDGQLIGPPHIKSAQRILSTSAQNRQDGSGKKGRVIRHLSDASMLPGAVISNPYEITITEGLLDLWLQSFYSHNPADTSRLYAEALKKCSGNAMPVPFMMMLYLCVSMSDTHGAIYHLGFRNGRQLRQIQTGDTLRQKITMLRVKNTEDGKRAVVSTLRELICLHSGEVVFRVEKLELYPAQAASFGGEELLPEISAKLPDDDAILRSALEGWEKLSSSRRKLAGFSMSTAAVEKGDILLHTFARPLGISTNLALSTRFLVTHPIHLDHHRFDQGDGLGVVVSGGLVISQILSSAARDISHILWEEILVANNVKTVSPNETIGAFSVIIDKADIPGSSGLEVLLVKTIGVKNINPAFGLHETDFPKEILQPVTGGGSKYEVLCRKYGLRSLEGNIAGEVLRRVVRVKET